MLESVSLAKLVRRHTGRTAWVIGGGPSLLEMDPEEIQRNDIVFAVNHHVETVKIGLPEAHYWIFIDIECPLYHGHLFEKPPGLYPGPVKICELQPGAFLMGRGFEPGGDGRGKHFMPVSFSQTYFPKSTDLVPAAKGATISGALHLAVIMGCNPIHIRGLDLKNGPMGRTYWNDVPGKASPSAPNYVWQREYLHQVIQQYLQTGLVITVKAASELVTEYFVPDYMRPAPLGELVPIGGRQ